MDPLDAHWEKLLESVGYQVNGDYATTRLE